jgi:cob(I)alamin adenosyltransferase
MQIYTRKGDDGTTGLLYGGRVRKDDPGPRAYGAVDEAQAAIGLARAAVRALDGGVDGDLDRLLIGLCRDLYVCMAELATAPEGRTKLVAGESSATAEMVAALEPLIDDAMGRFELSREFAVPGGDPVSAALDLARTVVRRAERETLVVAAGDSYVVPYLNRLSDLLWALARWREGDSHLDTKEQRR